MSATTALVLGLGASGLAMARWLARDGAAVRVWDSRESPPQAGALKDHVPRPPCSRVRSTRGAGRRRPHLPEPGPGAGRSSHRAGAAEPARRPVRASSISSRRRWRRYASDDYAPKVIAITGTNGKTTTTAMTALLVERSGQRVAAAGNIGPTMLQTLADCIDAGPAESLRDRLPEVWVLELSSFQLAGMAGGFDADAAALLNLSEDHLDWHGSSPTTPPRRHASSASGRRSSSAATTPP